MGRQTIGRRARRGRHRAIPSDGARIVRTGGALLGCGAVALVLTVLGPGVLHRAQADQRFVEAVRAEGRTVESGETEALVVRAAQKLCSQRTGGSSAARRESALTAEEVDAVRRTFGDDERAFMKVALRTYCT